jgi:transcriptional regulator with XRE-family HTH domain
MPSTAARRTTSRRRKKNVTAGQVVADQVKALRERRGVSQQQLADKIGESQSTVARIESGGRTITVDDVFKIAWALDCAPVHLLGAGIQAEDVPVTPALRLEPVEARAWIRGKLPLRDGKPRAYLFENIPDDEAEELFAAQERGWLEARLSLADLAVSGRAVSDVDPHEEKARLQARLAEIEAAGDAS